MKAQWKAKEELGRQCQAVHLHSTCANAHQQITHMYARIHVPVLGAKGEGGGFGSKLRSRSQIN